MRQPDDPSCFMTDEDGRLFRWDGSVRNWVQVDRKSFWRFFWERIKDDWDANRYSVLTAICVCLTPALFILALAFLP